MLQLESPQDIFPAPEIPSIRNAVTPSVSFEYHVGSKETEAELRALAHVHTGFGDVEAKAETVKTPKARITVSIATVIDLKFTIHFSFGF
jgi:hypothetical protein